MLQKMHKYKTYAGMRIPDQVFENIYATSSDPYGYTSSDYERQKYSATLAALSRESSAMSNIMNIGSISFAGSSREYSAIQFRNLRRVVLKPMPLTWETAH